MENTSLLKVTAYHEAAHAVVLYRTTENAGGMISIIAQPD